MRDAWTILPIEKQGNNYVITLVNNTEYASYVEYGHRQTPGRYVPALGKRLKAGWVKGRFMMTVSIQEVEQLAPAILEKAIYQALKGVF
ncbi:MAG: HK97 gp10 family phage protein [Oscillospiraceae bacterium]